MKSLKRRGPTSKVLVMLHSERKMMTLTLLRALCFCVLKASPVLRLGNHTLLITTVANSGMLLVAPLVLNSMQHVMLRITVCY